MQFRELRAGCPDGVPLGGIGTGMIDFLTDGRLGTVCINNNWAHPFTNMEGSFFALKCSFPEGKNVFRLLQLKSMGGCEGVNTLNYEGLYPAVKINYYIADVPLSIECEAFSPLIPHDVENSSIPGTVFIFRIKNNGNTKLKLSLFCSWENILGCGGCVGNIKIDRTGNYIEEIADNEKIQGLMFKSNQKCDKLNQNALGDYTLATLKNNDIEFKSYIWDCKSNRHIFFDSIKNSAGYKQDIPLSGIEGAIHPAGAIVLDFCLEPSKKTEIPVALSWYTPHLKLFSSDAIKKLESMELYAPQLNKNEDANDTKDQSHMNNALYSMDNSGIIDYGHYYQNLYNSSIYVAQDLLLNYKSYINKTKEIHELLKNTDLPQWLCSKIINDTVPLTTNTVLTKSRILYTLEASRGMEGALGTMDQRLIAHAAYQLFFPDINRSELREFAKIQADDGHIPHFCGNVYQKLGTCDVEYGDVTWPDLSCSFIIQCYRDLMNTGDINFLNEMLPHMLKAYSWLKKADKDGDGIPEGGSSWDVEHYDGLFVYTGTIWLAALRVMKKTAEIFQQEELIDDINRMYQSAFKSILNLWNGEYFNKVINYSAKTVCDEIFAGQLAGEWVVRLLGLESILPEEIVVKTLRTLYKFNGNRELYMLMPNIVTKQGLLTGRQNDFQAWPQYAAIFIDCLAIYSGLDYEGISSIKHFDDVIRKINHTPWTTTLWYDSRTGLPCWGFMDRYMNCTSAWLILNALTGFHADEYEKSFTIGPCRFALDNFKTLPVLSTLYWAVMDIKTIDYSQTRLTLKYKKLTKGKILLSSFRIRGNRANIKAAFNGNTLDLSFYQEKGYTKAVFLAGPIKISENDEIAVEYR